MDALLFYDYDLCDPFLLFGVIQKNFENMMTTIETSILHTIPYCVLCSGQCVAKIIETANPFEQYTFYTHSMGYFILSFQIFRFDLTAF